MSVTEPTVAVELQQQHSLSSSFSQEHSRSTRKRAFAPITDEDLRNFDKERLETEINEESYQEERMKQFSGGVQSQSVPTNKQFLKMEHYLQQAASEKESQIRLVNHVEECFRNSTMRGYVFPKKGASSKSRLLGGWKKGLEIELKDGEADEDASIESLKGVLVYDLHAQNAQLGTDSQVTAPKLQMIPPATESGLLIGQEPAAVQPEPAKSNPAGSIRNFLQKLDLRGFGQSHQQPVSSAEEYRLGAAKAELKGHPHRAEKSKQAKANQTQTVHNSIHSNADPGSNTSRGKRVKYKVTQEDRVPAHPGSATKSSLKAGNPSPKRPVLREFMQKFTERRENKERTTYPSKMNLLSALTNKRAALGLGLKKLDPTDRSKESAMGLRTQRDDLSKEGIQNHFLAPKPRNRMDAFLKYLKEPKNQFRRENSKNSTTAGNKSVTRAGSTHRSGAASIVELGRVPKQALASQQTITTPFKNWNNLIAGQVMQRPVSHKSFAHLLTKGRAEPSGDWKTSGRLPESKWTAVQERSKSPSQPVAKKRSMKNSLLEVIPKKQSPAKRVKRESSSLYFEPGSVAKQTTSSTKTISANIVAALKNLPFSKKQSQPKLKGVVVAPAARSLKASRSALLSGGGGSSGAATERKRDGSPAVPTAQSKYTTKITSITKLTINNQNAYMTFEGLGAGATGGPKPPKTTR